jgi:hypothetical protein
MKEPEKRGENRLEESVTNYDSKMFQTRLEGGRAVKARIVEVHCPYCMVGTAPMVVEGPDIIGPGDAQKADVKPKQCRQCKHWFRIGYRTQFVGIQMEG